MAEKVDYSIIRPASYIVSTESSSKRTAEVLTAIFSFCIILMISAPTLLDIANPFGLPGSISQATYYSVGILMLFAFKQTLNVNPSLTITAGVYWVVGLMLASVISNMPRKSLSIAISVLLYLLASYGIWKASINSRVYTAVLYAFSIAGAGWAFFILRAYYEYGYLPVEYYMKFKDVEGSYDRNFYGYFIANGAISLIALLTIKQPVLYRTLRLVVLSVAAAVIIISGSRQALLMVYISFFYFVIKSGILAKKGEKYLKYLWAILGICLIIYVLSETAQSYEKMAERFNPDIEFQEESNRGRIDLLKKAWIIIKKNPFGVGGGASKYTLVGSGELRNVERKVLHNQFLTMIAEGGWIVIIPVFLIFKNTFIIPLRYRWSEMKRLAIFCLWINTIISGIFSDFLGIKFFLMLALGCSSINAEQRKI